MIETMKINLKASAIFVKEDKIYITCLGPHIESIRTLVLDSVIGKTLQIGCFKGSKSYLVRAVNQKLFIGLDNKLLVSDSDGNWKTVLKCKRPSNFFWHMTISKDGTYYVQEYGEPPTGIYKSFDGENWDLLVSCTDIDKNARHFHSLTYDCYRDNLIATLGDGNRVRVAVSANLGKDWKPVYEGTWQVLPIAVLEDRVIFGMDSGIALGGVLTWFPSCNRFETIYLRWTNRNIRIQMSDLCFLGNNIWVAALGTPQAIVTSTNLRKWWPMHIEGFDDHFNHSMSISEGKSIVSFTTGNVVIIVKKQVLTKSINAANTVIIEHKALKEKLLNIGRIIKWNWLYGRKL